MTRHPYPMRYNPYRHSAQANPMSTGGKIALAVGITAVIVAPLAVAATAAAGTAWAMRQSEKMGAQPHIEGGYDPAMGGGNGGALPNPCGR